MTRPRIAVVISGVAASTAAFIVTSRWHLAGTLAGAAFVPVIYILVSHGSSQSVESLGQWVRRHQKPGPETDQLEPPATGGGASAPNGPPTGGRPRSQWLLAGFACLALALSIYALVVSGGIDRTVVRETVTQTVTVSSETTAVPAHARNTKASTTTTSSTAAEANVMSTTTQTTATTDATGAEPAATTTTSAPAGGDPSSSTTDTTLGSTTSLP